MSDLIGLSIDEILDLEATSSKRGVYGKRFQEWLDSDEPGIEPAAVWPQDFEIDNTGNVANARTTAAVSQGFTNVLNKHLKANTLNEGEVTVKVVKDRVYLLNHTIIARVRAERAAAASDEQTAQAA